jgi:hypothetical protein
MQIKHRRKICAGCNHWFTPNPKAAFHQRFCSKKRCQKARKVASYKRWLAQPGNLEHWRGPVNVLRVQEWRKQNPGYWRRKSTA